MRACVAQSKNYTQDCFVVSTMLYSPRKEGGEMKRLSQERSYFVVKDNELITKSRYSLTLQQQKILLYFISRIKPDDDEYTTYELSIKDFSKVCGYVEDSGFYYQTIKTHIINLI